MALRSKWTVRIHRFETWLRVGAGGEEQHAQPVTVSLDHLTRSLNWGLASALGGLLLVSVLVLYALYERFVGIANVRLG